MEFSVTDTGPGVPDEDRERVIQRFVRLENSRNEPGSGLGLSLVAAVAEAHRGRIELDEGPGVGGRYGAGPARGPGPAARGMSGLAGQLKPCGPVLDAGLAARTREPALAAAREDGWLETLDAAWPALAPVFAASPYLAGLARREPERLRAILEAAPDARLAAILAQTDALTGGADDLRAPLRGLKADLHLLTALATWAGSGTWTRSPAP